MKTLVVDGSTILGIVLKDEHSSITANTLEALESPRTLHVPVHWWIEISNGLLVAERRKRISRAEIAEAISFIQSFPVLVDDQTARRASSETFELARQYELTIYDAAYLELAIRRSSILSTVDKALARAAAAAGVELVAGNK